MSAKHPSLTLKPALLAILLAFPAQQALAAACTWNVTSGNWATPSDWLSCGTGNGNPATTPGSSDTANIGATGVVTINTGQSILTLNNAGQINIDAFGLNLVGGGSTTNSGVINVGGASTANIGVSPGHNINNTGGIINIDDGSVVNQFGSTITGGTINTADSGKLVAFNSNINLLNGVTLGGTLDLASGTGVERVVGGLTLNNGTINVNSNSVLSFNGNQTLGGNGTVVLGNTGASNRALSLEGNTTLTIGSNVVVRGENGTLGQVYLSGGAQSLVNDGRISADVSGGTINLSPGTSMTNNGVLEAQNGGTLVLNATVTSNVGSHIDVGAGSTVLQNGVGLNGVINSAGGGAFRAINHNGNTLTGVSFTGTLDLATASSIERVFGGLTLNGTVNLNSNSVLSFNGDQTLGGNGTVVLGNTGASNRALSLEGNTRLTIGSNVVVRGENGTLGQAYLSGGAQSLVNDGRISADVSGGTVHLAPASGTTNNGILEAQNGGTLFLDSNVTGTPGGSIVAGAGSTVWQNGVGLSGVINSVGSGSFRVSNNNTNALNGVTFNGPLDLASSTGVERVFGGLTLNGSIDVNSNSVLSFNGDQTLGGNGTIVLGNTGASNRALSLEGNTALTIGSNVVVRGENGTLGQAYLSGGTQSLINNGAISADVSGGIFNLVPASGTTNNGVLEARNGGTLVLGSAVTNTGSGHIDANNGTVRQNGVTVAGGTINTLGTGRFSVSNSNSNFLDGVTVNGGLLDLATGTGIERVVNGLTLSSNGIVQVNSNSVLSFNGNQTIGGSGQIVLGDTGGSNRALSLEGNTALTIGQNVLVHGINGTLGQTYLAGGTQQLINQGTIASDGGGTITVGVNSGSLVNNGTMRAQNGTLTIQNALTGTGALQVDPTGVLNLTNTAHTQGRLAIAGAGSTLNIGTQNLTINADYTNVAAGAGNAFNRRAGVSGLGQIVAGGDVVQAITGSGVTGGSTANATLTINNVRVGDTTFNYQIANNGTTGPALRGAVQTSVNGANLSDARLSGDGVTPGNYNTGAPGSSTADLGVTFSAASAGTLAALSGQVLNLRSNFENIADQKLNIVLAGNAAAYNAAVGSAGSPVLVANQRVGGSNTATVTVSNTAAAGAFSEDLNVSSGGASGAASGSGSIVGRLAATSNTGTGAITARVDTTSAGAKTGNLTLDYQTAGAVAGVSNGLGTASVGNQVLTVSGDVYRLAQGAATPTPIVFANRHVDDSAIQLLTVQNTAAADGFSEKLNASISSNGAPVTASGGVNLLAAQATNSTSLQVGIDTSSAGAKSGSATISYVSDGTGSSGLAAISAGSQTINVSGDVYRLASANTLGDIAFGNVHVGDFVQQALNISNTALADSFSEKLNASFGTSSDARITTSGSISQLAAQSSNNTSMVVGLDTAAAGNVNGTQVINFASDGAGTSGLGITALAAQTIGVSGDITTSGSVFRLASASAATPNPVNFGALRIGSTAEQALSITNTAANDGFSEKLNASISTNGAPVTASGAFSLLAAQDSNSSGLHVGIDTSSAGAKSGSATIALVSDGTGTSGLASTNLPSQTVNVSGDVYRLANAILNTTAVTLLARRGDAAPTAAISVSNASPDSFTEGLKAGFGAVAAGFSGSGTIANLAAQGSDASSLQIALDTGSAGSLAGSAELNFESTGTGTTGAADISVGSQLVSLAGKVYEKAVAQVNTVLVDFGIVHKGEVVAAKNVSVSNSAPVTVLNDALQGSFMNMPDGPFGGSGSVSGLAAGETDTSSLLVSLDTTSAGVFTRGGEKLQFASHNPDMADLDLGNAALTLQAQVNDYANPNFLKTSGTGLLSGGGFDFLLDFGTLTAGSGMVSALLQLANDVSGPADLLDGAYRFALNEFLKTGFDGFSDLGAGDAQSGLRISLDTLNVGHFSDTIVLAAVGHNASGFSAAFQDIRLTVQARVEVGGSQIPEPATLLLLTIALAIIVLQRRRETLG